MIGVAGAGHMGGAVARRLLATGHQVAVHDVQAGAMTGLVKNGAVPCPDLYQFAAACGTVLLSLPSHVEVEQVCRGGLLAGMRPGALLINATTGSAGAVGPLADACAARGLLYVTAPVSQGCDGAERGELTAFTAGEDYAVAAARPVLAVFCSTVIRLPSHEAAMAAKLVTNLAWFVNAAALGGIMTLAVTAGIPAGQVQEVLTASCGDSWAARHDIPSVLDGHYDPSFTLGLCLKDLGLAAEMAAACGTVPRALRFAAAEFRQAEERYGPDAPELSPVRLAEEETGVTLARVPAPA